MKSSKILFFLLFPFLFSCTKKEIEKRYVYGVDSVTIREPGTDKPSVKTTTEFISIAFTDLFGTPISNSTLIKLSNAYSSFGDKKLVEDMIIRNFLNTSTVSIPSETTMRGDVGKFVTDCYKKFYNRYPTEYEKWFMSDLVNKDTSIKPEQIYYSFLTSNEYRYY